MKSKFIAMETLELYLGNHLLLLNQMGKTNPYLKHQADHFELIKNMVLSLPSVEIETSKEQT